MSGCLKCRQSSPYNLQAKYYQHYSKIWSNLFLPVWNPVAEYHNIFQVPGNFTTSTSLIWFCVLLMILDKSVVECVLVAAVEPQWKKVELIVHVIRYTVH